MGVQSGRCRITPSPGNFVSFILCTVEKDGSEIKYFLFVWTLGHEFKQSDGTLFFSVDFLLFVLCIFVWFAILWFTFPQTQVAWLWDLFWIKCPRRISDFTTTPSCGFVLSQGKNFGFTFVFVWLQSCGWVRDVHRGREDQHDSKGWSCKLCCHGSNLFIFLASSLFCFLSEVKSGWGGGCFCVHQRCLVMSLGFARKYPTFFERGRYASSTSKKPWLWLFGGFGAFPTFWGGRRNFYAYQRALVLNLWCA